MNSKEMKLATVYTAYGMAEAEIVRGRLENEGIPAILRYEAAGLIYGLTIDGLGQVKVQVPEKFKEIALEILNTTEQLDINQSDQD